MNAFFRRCAGLLPLTLALFAAAPAFAQNDRSDDGLIKVRSAYPLDETVARVRKDIADKGIMFFSAVDQAKLAADAGISLRPSTLLTSATRRSARSS